MNKVARGVAWLLLDKIGARALQFGIGIVIARMLSPSDYGVLGMMGLFIAVAGVFSDGGMASALIRNTNRKEEDYNTVFWFNIIIGLLLYAVIFICAPCIAQFYDLAALTLVARVLAFQVVIDAIMLVFRVRLTINMRFEVCAYAALISMIFSGVVGIVLAYFGFGVWSLVGQILSGGMVQLAIFISATLWMPRFIFSIDSFRNLFGFGWKILAASLINTVYGNLYAMVIGKRFSAADVGLYVKGSTFATLPAEALTQSIVNVNYPVLAALQNDLARLRESYIKLLRTPIFILVPVLVGVCIFAPNIISLLLGAKWLPCVTYLRILCFAAIWEPLIHINLNVLYTLGRSDLVLKLECIKKPIGFAILFASMPFGIKWMCLGRAVYGFIAYVINSYYTGKFLGYGFWKQMHGLVILR